MSLRRTSPSSRFRLSDIYVTVTWKSECKDLANNHPSSSWEIFCRLLLLFLVSCLQLQTAIWNEMMLFSLRPVLNLSRCKDPMKWDVSLFYGFLGKWLSLCWYFVRFWRIICDVGEELLLWGQNMLFSARIYGRVLKSTLHPFLC
jgi:hypothetical protein